jgi:hypothetical protein
MLALLAAACSATGDGTSEVSRSPDASATGIGEPTGGSPPAGWVWDAAPAEDHTHVIGDVEAEAGDPADQPDSEALGEVALEPPPAGPLVPDPVNGEGMLDPCALVLIPEWEAWTSEALGAEGLGTPATVLEDGEACGWMAAGDGVRMALGIFRAAGPGRWLSDAEAAAATPVDGLGHDAYWLSAWPLEQSSTLVVQAADLDVVIEVSARDASDALLRDGAQHFATLVLDRLP